LEETDSSGLFLLVLSSHRDIFTFS